MFLSSDDEPLFFTLFFNKQSIFSIASGEGASAVGHELDHV